MEQKQQIAEKLKTANNILVTVSTNPSVDQLASCIGLTLALNKMGKHATAVFSGAAPSTIEFLQPEKTFESNIDSLRDFIISLDKTKADKLRYKVEDAVVKIFITPYHTSLSNKDLEFSQGDFNVEAVVALGVAAQGDIDQAIAAHGRILHDAAVLTINIKPGGEFGSVNWMEPESSSLCELAAELVSDMDKQAMDGQIATALLTGIVAETNRFSNNRTTPITMSVSASLMAAGANQQLVVTKLEQAAPAAAAPLAQQTAPGEIQIRQNDTANAPAQQDGATLSIGGGEAPQPAAPPSPVPVPEPPKSPEPHKSDEDSKPLASLEDLTGPPVDPNKEPELARIRIDDQGSLHTVDEAAEQKEATTDPTIHMGGSRMILQPPTMGDGASGIIGNGSYSDPLTAPKAGAPPAGQPSAAPTPPPTQSPLTPPTPSAISPPPAPFTQSPLTPPPAASASLGATFPSSPVLASVTGSPAGLPAPEPVHIDSARDAVSQAFGSAAVPAPSPDMGTPAPVAPAVPVSTGPPPPVPPPMVPTFPQ